MNVILISITIFLVIIISIVLYFVLKPQKSNLSMSSNINNEKKIAIAAVSLYNNAFAGREQGKEDLTWNNKLFNSEFNITIDYNYFKDYYATSDNIVNGKWVKLSMPKI
jgi:hypothetical protein